MQLLEELAQRVAREQSPLRAQPLRADIDRLQKMGSVFSLPRVTVVTP